ncbi:LysR family transcriptional regulator [Breoghania corrubedonensis]|uniref:LysR family transcriptional regulator n=1 Tax=Breoghania corrubedonensis TaxID=665038 RepID=A0A2T5V6L5_9HYPH|nr:LysR family transcriptional regulator [Breoghania corrubedonensis]PTW59393.1 LysR family transcriptional regulator [Breoghania corrubedonensis]
MINVSLRRLEVFLAIVDTGSFSRAAELLNIAQPSVSAHVRALEERLGGLVFERRRGGRPLLTELGRAVREHAREMLAEVDDMRADIINMRGGASDRLVISIQRGLANFALKDALTSFALTRPDQQLVVRVGKHEEVVHDLRESIANVGCVQVNEDIRGLSSRVIGAQKLKLIASPDHPLAKRRHIRPETVARYSFVGAPPSSVFGKSVARLLASIGIRDPNTAAQATEYQFLRELVVAGVGIACSTEASITPDVAAGKLVVLDVAAEDLFFEIRVLTAARRPLSPSMQDLIDHLAAAAPHP